MGRPEANIDWKEVDKYLQAQCDGVGIAGILGIATDTLYRRCKEDNKVGFADYSAQKKAEGVELLKSKQYQTAIEGSVPMLIWLGKQYAGQKDKTTNDHNVHVFKVVWDERDGPAGDTPEETTPGTG